MRVVIFGASGRTGRQLVAQALDRRYAVTAFVRNPAKLPLDHRDLRVMQGDVADAAAVRAAIEGQDAVVSALGVARPLRHDAAVVAGIGHLVREMAIRGPQRLVYLSTVGVRESRHTAGFVIRHIAPIPLRQEFADHEAKEAMIKASSLDWTIVRAPVLTDGPRTGRYRGGLDLSSDRAFSSLSRADVADFMLRLLTDTTYSRKAVSLFP